MSSEELKEAQELVKKILADPKKFDESFEKQFHHYDKNNDGHIEMREYGQFMDDFLSSINQKKVSFSTILKNWREADKNHDGKLSKQEFKDEVFKKMQAFADNKF